MKDPSVTCSVFQSGRWEVIKTLTVEFGNGYSQSSCVFSQMHSWFNPFPQVAPVLTTSWGTRKRWTPDSLEMHRSTGKNENGCSKIFENKRSKAENIFLKCSSWVSHRLLAAEEATFLNSFMKQNLFLSHPVGSYKIFFGSSGILDSHLQQFICDASLPIIIISDTKRAVVCHFNCCCFCQHSAMLAYCFFQSISWCHSAVVLTCCWHNFHLCNCI